jgi:hydroxymethylpyrimidine pyrophosphatase-like HAD family hydrolase
MLKVPGLWITDYDGTIKPPNSPVSFDDLWAFKELGQAGAYRVIATGRSLWAFKRDWIPELELDYLIFSSGLGLCSWSEKGAGPLISSFSFSQNEISQAYEASLILGYGFFAYQPPPDCHKFFFKFPEKKIIPEGFWARLKLYNDVASPFSSLKTSGKLGQFLVMIPHDEMPYAQAKFKSLCPELSLTISSSPYNDHYLWLEIFPPGISKGQAADFLTRFLDLNQEKTVALGNDYNDSDLLSWANQAFVVYDAPLSVKKDYRVIPQTITAPLAYVVKLLQQENIK